MRYAPALPIVLLALLGGCTTPPRTTPEPVTQVLFVCEHGNVKSLMAATYFNQLAGSRNLPFHGVSRGSAPDSDTVPPKIIAGLDADGFDVSTFHPVAVSAADVSASRRVVTIGTTLPDDVRRGATVEQWSDVPPASVDFSAARAALRTHVQALLDGLAADEANAR